MKRPDDPEVAEWLRKADDDLGIAGVLLASETDYFWAICFHCQQAAEKAVKALLVAIEVAPPRSHDIETLLSMANDRLADVLDAARALSVYAVLPRYPISGVGSTAEAAAEAADMARRVRGAVKREFDRETDPESDSKE